MRFRINRTVARGAVAVAAAVVGSTTLFAAPAANAALVSTNSTYTPGYTTVVVDLTLDDVGALRSSSQEVRFDKALWLCNNQVVPNAGQYLTLHEKYVCQSILVACANKQLPDGHLPTAYISGNGNYWCGTYRVVSMEQQIGAITEIARVQNQTLATSVATLNDWWVQTLVALGQLGTPCCTCP